MPLTAAAARAKSSLETASLSSFAAVGSVPQIPPRFLVHFARAINYWRRDSHIFEMPTTRIQFASADSAPAIAQARHRCLSNLLLNDLRETMRDAMHTSLGTDIDSCRRLPFVVHGLNIAPIKSNGRVISAICQVQRQFKSTAVSIACFQIKFAVAEQVVWRCRKRTSSLVIQDIQVTDNFLQRCEPSTQRRSRLFRRIEIACIPHPHRGLSHSKY